MRVGILGAGDMGRVHAMAYRAMAGVEIAGIAGRSDVRANQLGAELGVPATTDPWVFLDNDSVDAVDVTYPSALHREWVVAALQRGMHVFCETPMALTLADADAMIDAARQQGRILMPAQVHRFGTETAFIHAAVTSGSLGRPLVAYYGSRSPFYGAGRSRAIELYGDPILDLMIHPFDSLNWLLGLPVSLSGTGVVGPSGSIDYALVSLAFDGASGMVEGSAMMPASFPFTVSLRVLCEEGALETQIQLGGASTPEIITLIRYPVHGEAEDLHLQGRDPYEAECEYFVRSVRGEADPALISPAGERSTLRVALAAREAIEQGRQVSLR
ncbi:MAG: Gfo/Idh/MocA family protein [Dehalococcoidia bacterium]